MGRAARAAGVAIVGGDTKVVEHGKADRLYITTTGIGRPLPGVSLGARDRSGRATSSPLGTDRRPRHHHPARAGRPRSRGRPLLRYARGVPPRRGAGRGSGAGIRWMRDPTRGGVATSLNELALDCGLGVTCSRRRSRCATKCAAPASCSASTRCTSPTRASSSRSSPPDYADRGARGPARRPAAKTRRSSARSASSRPARCCVDPVRWHPDRRHVGRRPAAAHLLRPVTP